MKLYDTVTILANDPDSDVQAGTVGAVVDTNGNTVTVEFVADDGKTQALVTDDATKFALVG